MQPNKQDNDRVTITIYNRTKKRLLELWKKENQTRDADLIKSWDSLLNEMCEALEDDNNIEGSVSY